MKKGVNWLYASRVVLILKYLVIMPRTPMQLRMLTKIPGNYVNIILKRLEEEGIVICLTPKESIGKVFYIRAESKDLVERILKKSGYTLKLKHLPDLNWKAYGRLSCRYCRQLRMVFKRACELKQEGKEITVSSLKEKLPGMATSNLYRALDGLAELGLMSCKDASSRQFIITEEGSAIIKFEPDVLNIDW